MKKILSFALSFLLLASSVWAGDTTSNGYFYLPSYGASGAAERTSWYSSLEATDAVLDSLATTQTNLNAINGILRVDGSGGFSADTSVNNLITLTGMADGSTNLGEFTGLTISDSSTIKNALQELETVLESSEETVTDLVTLTGMADGSTNLGEFSGLTIADSSTIKGALQDLETAIEVVFNVKSYDATGDGSADDTTEIAAAAAAAEAVNGVLYFPPGTYKITGKISFKQGIILGYGATLSKKYDGIGLEISEGGSTYTKVYGLGVYGDHAANPEAVTSHGIYIKDSRVILRDVSSSNNGGDGIKFETDDGNCNQSELDVVALSNGVDGVLLTGAGTDMQNLRLYINTYGNAGDGLSIETEAKYLVGKVIAQNNTGTGLNFSKGDYAELEVYLESNTAEDYNIAAGVEYSTLRGRLGTGTQDTTTSTDSLTYGGNYELIKGDATGIGRYVAGTNVGVSASEYYKDLFYGSDGRLLVEHKYRGDGVETIQSYHTDGTTPSAALSIIGDDNYIAISEGSTLYAGSTPLLASTNTFTDTKYCIFTAGTGIVCNSTVNADGINWATLQLIDSSSTSIQLSQAQSSSMVLDQDGVHVGKKLYVGLAAGETSSMQFLEDPDNGTNYVAIHPPSSLTSNYDLTFPEETGTMVSDQSAALNEKFFSGTILDPADGDSAQISSNDDYAITLNSFKCQVADGSTSVPYTLYECTNPTTCTIVKTQFTCSTGGISFTAFDDSSIASSSSLIMGGGAPTGSPEAIFFSGKYTITR